MRTHGYVDGFNLYYRALQKTNYKWLDLRSLFEKILSNQNDILCIKYYTALVLGPANDPQKPTRQQKYLKAINHYIPEIQIHYGHFLSHKISAPLANPTPKSRFVDIVKTEEKGSDVNLAVHLLNDAWLNKYNCAVIVSNDSDLAEAMCLVKKHHKLKGSA